MGLLNGSRRSEVGQASILLVVGAIIAVFLLASVFQVHRIVLRSATGQDGTDAAARAAATWQARGLNVIGSANVAQSLLLLEYLVPFGSFSENRPYLAESAAHLTRLQEEVAVLFPALGLVSACAVGRKAGLSPLSADNLRRLDLDEYADALDELEESSDLGRILAGGVYALPLDYDGSGRRLSLGVSPVAPNEMGGLLERVIREGLVQAVSVLEELDAVLSIVPPHPVIFFGDHGIGSWWDTQVEEIEDDVLEMLYTKEGGGTETIRVLTWRGRRKLEIYLGRPVETVPVGEEGFPVVPALGPISVEQIASRLGRSPEELLGAATRLGMELLREADEVPFSFFVHDPAIWEARAGVDVTILGRAEGWSSGALTGGAVPAHFFARAAPWGEEEPSGAMVVPVYDEVRLLPVGEEVLP